MEKQMMKIILLNSSTDLDSLRSALAQAHSLRVSIDDDGVKFKVNGGTWSPPMGFIDPDSEYAYENRPVVSTDGHSMRIGPETTPIQQVSNKPGDPCPTENCEGIARWIPISEGNRGSKVYRCADCCDEIDAK